MSAIVLVGFRACGKTTIGQAVAAHLGCRFVDLDAQIEQRIGCPINHYFSTHGEAAFRLIESEELSAALKSTDKFVLSTGGGCVLKDENRAILREKSGIVIYISVAVAELQRRLRHNDGDRPSLTGQSVVAEVPTLLAQREPLYRSVAQAVVDGNAARATVITRVLAIVENLV